MNVLIFVTDNGSPEGTGPVLFLNESAQSALPPNPRSFPWRYFATVTADDRIVDAEARDALQRGESFVSHRIIGRLPAAWLEPGPASGEAGPDPAT